MLVYISHDAYCALHDYLKSRSLSRVKGVFLVGKGMYRGTPISVRGIQKRIEYYARKAGLNISCHYLRHTMATQLLNADADLVTIQDLLGHTRIKTTQRYARVSNLKVQRDYYKAMEVILQRSAQENIGLHPSIDSASSKQISFKQGDTEIWGGLRKSIVGQMANSFFTG